MIKIIAITGYYSEENRTRIMDAGADYFMKKPMPLDDLRKVLDKAVGAFSGKYILEKKSKEEVANG